MTTNPPTPPTDEGTTQRPGGWFDGFHLALLSELPVGTRYRVTVGGPTQTRADDARQAAWDAHVIVMLWPDGEIPRAPAAPVPATPAEPEDRYWIKVQRATYEAEQAAKAARRREANEGVTDPHPLELLLRSIVDPEEACDCALAVIEAGMYAVPARQDDERPDPVALYEIADAFLDEPEAEMVRAAARFITAHTRVPATPADERQADALDLPTARAVINWWLADEYGSLDAAVEGVLWTDGGEPPREQTEQVLDALRQVLKSQEFEDD